jgi:hypothetical protein
VSDWDPRDPDAASVRYDLEEWSVSERAEAAAAFAEEGIAHAWDADELIVPASDEQRADALLDRLEERLGIGGDDDDEEDDEDDDDDEPDANGIIEYGLDEYSEAERSRLGEMLDNLDVGHRWQGAILLVPAAVEPLVEQCLEAIDDDSDGVEFVDD